MADLPVSRSYSGQGSLGPRPSTGMQLKSQVSGAGAAPQRQTDVLYMSELLSYSLDRLRKVCDGTSSGNRPVPPPLGHGCQAGTAHSFHCHPFLGAVYISSHFPGAVCCHSSCNGCSDQAHPWSLGQGFGPASVRTISPGPPPTPLSPCTHHRLGAMSFCCSTHAIPPSLAHSPGAGGAQVREGAAGARAADHGGVAVRRLPGRSRLPHLHQQRAGGRVRAPGLTAAGVWARPGAGGVAGAGQRRLGRQAGRQAGGGLFAIPS